MGYWLYRTRQLLNGLRARVDEESLARAQQLLPPPALALFQRLPVDTQHHSLNVLRTLQDAGHADPTLLQAALLHDVGKAAAAEAGARLGPWRRSLVVLLEEFAPQQLERWAASHPSAGWRYALHVHIHHPRMGAEWAATAGCSADTCWLIEHHQERYDEQRARTLPPERWTHLQALQRADNMN